VGRLLAVAINSHAPTSSPNPELDLRSNAMMTKVGIRLWVALLLGAGALPAQAQSLGIGDPAPKLVVKGFVKGEPVTKFEPGKNYVVEFWATWCPPCRTSIPHLTELQKKNPSVTFIGVSIAEEDQANVKPFVKEMAEKMDYRVAIDLVPEHEKSDPGAMAKTWMAAAGQEGIPAAFIVNKEGKIAWIGHPMRMDKPLEKIIAGTWDVAEAREEQRKGGESQRKAGEAKSKEAKFKAKLGSAFKSGDPGKVVAAIDEIISEDLSAESTHGPTKLTALIKLDEQARALEYAKKLAKSDLSKDAQSLNGLAWAIIDPDAGIKPGTKLIEFAVETARRADVMAGNKDASIADTLAIAYFDSGDVAKAVETQERAVRLASGSQNDRFVDDLRGRLEKYKKAVK
jgi:thiol-disulfide isomerase/thioredoxin